MEFEGCLNGGKSMKAYLKPVLYYEWFELSQHIASCHLKLNHNLGNGVCTATDDTIGWSGLFVRSDTTCTTPMEEYCYTSSAEIEHTYAS